MLVLASKLTAHVCLFCENSSHHTVVGYKLVCILYIIPRCLGQKETSVFKKNKQREFVRSEHMKSPRFCVLGHLLYQTEKNKVKRRTNNERKLRGNTNQCHRRKAGVNLVSYF